MALIVCPDCGNKVSSEAPACPNCGRPIKGTPPPIASPSIAPAPAPAPPKKKTSGCAMVFLVIVGVVGILMYLGSSHQGGSPSPDSTSAPAQAAPAPQESILKVTPTGLYQAYKANEVATDNELHGHILELTAPVASIDKDFTDSAVLKFNTGDEFGELQATLKDDQKPAAANLRQGQKVTLHCESSKRIMNSPMLNDCMIVQ